MTADNLRLLDRNDRDRFLRRAGLTGALLFAAMAALLWLGANFAGAKHCLDNAHGLGVEGGGISMTAHGCEVTVPISGRVSPNSSLEPRGLITGVIPTLDESIATVALIAGLAGAIPPSICLWLATRGPR